ncbi:MAG TPA: SDR family oxidoreductase [Alphaproteobacteria bacterium]|nr:SDR family oxidoreductase [Alphaproteobacteria bacterium]
MEPIVITGASRGIGAQSAILAAKQGYAVCVNYLRSAAAANRVVEVIRTEGGEAFAFQADCRDEEAVRAMFDAVVARYGAVTALVNNAGILGGRARLADLDIGALRSVVDTNLVGTIICAREAVRRMSRLRGGKGGAIVNVSSVAARHGGPGGGIHYAATKGAVDVFTTGLAKEVMPEGIRVNAVSPGVTLTDMTPPAQVQQAVASVPIGRAADPIEIAQAILWLISPAASYVVGANLLVAGGRV